MALTVRLIAACLCLAASACVRAGEEVYRDKFVTAYVDRPSPLLGNVHGDESVTLKAFGKTYKSVRGGKPYYMQVPELNSILFVTEDQREEATLHLVSLETTNETKISLGACNFGSNIGYERRGKKRGDRGTDYLENVTSTSMELHGVSFNWKEIDLINLVSKSVERRETTYFDKDGKVTKRFIDGKRVD